ncbi:hypothetical protein IEO21_07245 [Rhodonia placenta]|uniref:Spermatogenesis-associated protein 20-like TRX domain-containing protein n=1 Tax=Rhodonia placenta TaxID=104341 RepID=A0A8H7NYH6_9APHY|nr:hypothetical protein IEO21_07245 [Postia placenta]
MSSSTHPVLGVAAGSRARNRLAQAKSPYLLQHAENPVDWYEWCSEAFEKARKEDKLIFLSVGYSACHWCHVLAHESFEDEVTAKMMNEYYVNIKVDREERPDVDRLYMTFLQATTGGGGWPMSVWLTPDLHPFFAGTYFPPGQFRQVLMKLADMWETDPNRCKAAGKQMIEQLREMTNVQSGSHDLPITSLASSIYSRLAKRFDPKYGGFGGAPKFPQPAQTTHFLARYAALNLDRIAGSADAEHARDMAVYTLVQIYNGGIHDVVGGGFARYSVDEKWHVPHCRPFTYDQGQLLASAVELALILPESSPSRGALTDFARSILKYLPRHLTSPDGGFYSAEDADSLPTPQSKHTKEGAFYTWTAQELRDVLGADSEILEWVYGIKMDGNCDPAHDIQGELTGQNVLYVAHEVEEVANKFGRPVEILQQLLQQCLEKLRLYREEKRPRPHLDDKILTAWNGLMISGLAKASELLRGEEAIQALSLAAKSTAFLRSHVYSEASGELVRSWREGPGPKGQADDYAFLIQGLLDLHEASGKEEYITWAVRLQEKQDELFFDKEGGGYFASAPDEHIILRMKDAQDGAEPSAVSVTLSNLLRLAHFAEDRYKEYQEKANSVLAANAQLLGAAPFALATMVSAAMLTERGLKQFVLTETPSAPRQSPFLDVIRERFIPNRVLIHIDPAHPPRNLARANATLRTLIEDLDKNKGVDVATTVPSVHICENFTCGLPIKSVEKLKSIL